MKCLIVLALAAVATAAPQYYNSFAIPTVLPDGHLADTPEVAAAKAFHFGEHAKALAGSAPVNAYAAPAPLAYANSYYSGPLAVPTVLPDGHLADTPEVSAAKAIHYAEHAKALALAPAPIAAAPVVPHIAAAVAPTPYYKSYYSGAWAVPTVLPDGHLADTPEVAAAKAFHFSEHAKALSLSPY